MARWDKATMGSHLSVGLRCAPFVAMVKAADFGDLNHRSPVRWLDRPGLGCVPVQRQVRPRSVIVVDVAARNPPQVGFAENDDVIEALPTQGGDYSLCIRFCQGLCGAMTTSSISSALTGSRNARPQTPPRSRIG